MINMKGIGAQTMSAKGNKNFLALVGESVLANQ